MTAFAHGLVIGKFYPPHRGHHFLIDTAAAACDRVTVVIAGSSAESLPLGDRVAWVSSTHSQQPHVRVVGATDDHPIDYHDDEVWAAHVGVFRAAVARAAVLDGVAEEARVDAVFSSEPYGDELARRFGATSVAVDAERTTHPCSSTRVRDDVAGRWSDLAPATRTGLALRVVFVGAESTGTTTVSRAVAEQLGTSWVPEYGREFTIGLLAATAAQATALGAPPPTMDDLPWRTEDFVAIAERQVALEDAAAAVSAGGVVVCDTDAFATGMWHERYLGSRSSDVERWADARPHPLYLVTSPRGVPFEQDGIRDGEHLREWMTERFVDELTATGRSWRMLGGPVAQRVDDAVAAIDELRRRAPAWRFTDPLQPRIREVAAP
jgi:NadR type nicotinamide-nucleotide adenylyltransferase